MTLPELEENINQIIEKEKNKDMLYFSYLSIKKNSLKLDKLQEMVKKGIERYNEGNYKAAYQIFSEAIDFETDADAFYNRGTTCMDLGNLRIAIHDFTAAIIYCPTYGKPYLNRGLCVAQILSDNGALFNNQYADLKEFAKKDLKKAIELGHESAKQYLVMLN